MLTKSDLSQIRKAFKSELKNYPTKNNLETSLKPIKDDAGQIRKDIKTISSFFDTEYIELRKRIERIEFHLNLQQA